MRRGLIVGYCSLITAGVQQIEDKTPIHNADMQAMIEVVSKTTQDNCSS